VVEYRDHAQSRWKPAMMTHMTHQLHIPRPAYLQPRRSPFWRSPWGTLAAIPITWGVIVMVIVWLIGCTPAGTPTPQGQALIDVACDRDATLQPIIVPVVAMASPAAGSAQPAVAAALAADQVLVHPSVVAACAAYHSKPAAVVAAVPPGAVVAAPVLVTPAAVKPAV
jgi:hypothetical protein